MLYFGNEGGASSWVMTPSDVGGGCRCERMLSASILSEIESRSGLSGEIWGVQVSGLKPAWDAVVFTWVWNTV